MFGCVVVGRVYYNFPRFFYNVEFVRPKWSFFYVAATLPLPMFFIYALERLSQFSHSKPIRKRPQRASQVSFYVVVAFEYFNVNLAEATNAAIALLLPLPQPLLLSCLSSCHNYQKLCDVIKCGKA